MTSTQSCQLDLCAQRINKLCRCFLRSVFVPEIQKYFAIKDAERPEDPNLGRHLRKENRSIYLACPRPAKSIGLHCQGIRDYQINVKSMHLIYQLLNITAIATIIELSRPSKLPHTQYQPCDEYGMLHTPCSHQLSSLQPTWLQCTIGKDASGFMVN